MCNRQRAFLGTLGASAAAISIIAGAGEFLGYSLRSPISARGQNHAARRSKTPRSGDFLIQVQAERSPEIVEIYREEKEV
jgi:hypothetical protein